MLGSEFTTSEDTEIRTHRRSWTRLRKHSWGSEECGGNLKAGVFQCPKQWCGSPSLSMNWEC